MKTERHGFQVQSTTPPTVEIDTASNSVYVRFKKAAVARTVSNHAQMMHIAVDLDSKGEVVGIEAVGVTEFNLTAILRNARVHAPRVNASKVRYVPAGLSVAGGVPA